MGDKLKLYIEETSSVIDALVDYARSKELNIVSINTIAPSMEDVFLKLVKEN